MMTRWLPLFPLGTVLFPGLVLPLHVFEPRYRAMVRDLLALPEGQREFGVVAIRKGREVGVDGVTALHDVGCVARVEQVRPHADGRFDLVSVGTARFRLVGTDASGDYVRAEVEPLAETTGDAERLAGEVRSAFATYVTALAGDADDPPDLSDLPADPLALSYLVGATVRIDLAERQALLAAADAGRRLMAELALLRRETTLFRTLPSAPATTELTRTPVSPN